MRDVGSGKRIGTAIIEFYKHYEKTLETRWKSQKPKVTDKREYGSIVGTADISGHTFPWNPTVVEPLRVPLRVCVFDIQFSADLTTEFWAWAALTLAWVGAFVVCATTQRLAPVAQVTSTVLVIPLAKHMAAVFDCALMEDGTRTLDAAPAIICFKGAHLWLSVITAFLSVIYLFLLLSFTAAEGDLKLVPPRVWCQPEEWIRRKMDKANSLNLGRMQPASNRSSLLSAYAELIARLMMASSAVFSTVHPLRHAGVSLFASVLLAVVTCRFAPRTDRAITIVVNATRWLGVVAWSAACIAVQVGRDGGRVAWMAPTLLYGGMAAVGVVATVLVVRVERPTTPAVYAPLDAHLALQMA